MECPQAPDFSYRFSVQNGAIFLAVLEAVPQCVVGLDGKNGFISSSTFYYWCFLEKEVEAANTVTTPSTHENNKTHVQYCFITIFGRKGQTSDTALVNGPQKVYKN